MGDVFLLVSALGVAVAVLVFLGSFLREPWKDSQFGRSVIELSAGILVLSTYAILNYALGPDYWGRDILVTLGRLLIIVALVRRTVFVRRKQRERASEEGDRSRMFDRPEIQ